MRSLEFGSGFFSRPNQVFFFLKHWIQIRVERQASDPKSIYVAIDLYFLCLLYEKVGKLSDSLNNLNIRFGLDQVGSDSRAK